MWISGPGECCWDVDQKNVVGKFTRSVVVDKWTRRAFGKYTGRLLSVSLPEERCCG